MIPGFKRAPMRAQLPWILRNYPDEDIPKELEHLVNPSSESDSDSDVDIGDKDKEKGMSYKSISSLHLMKS